MQRTAVSRETVFSAMPVPRAIATMAIPTIVSQLINLIYNLADAVFIGRTGNVAMSAAITVSFTVFMMTISFSNLFGVGGGSLMARLTGKGQQAEAQKVCAFSFYGALGISLLYSLVIGLWMEPILRLLGAKEATIGYAMQYVLLVVVVGNVSVILSQTLAHLLRNAGYSRQASLGLGGGGLLNLALDPLFMFVLLPRGSEVLGAALATLLSNMASCCYLLLTLRRLSRSAPLSLRLKDALQIKSSALGRLFAVGIPSACLTALFDAANIVMIRLTSAYTTAHISAIGIVMRAERLPNAIGIGLCQGMLPLVAYNYASGDRARMRQIVKAVRCYGLAISAGCILLFELLAPQLSRVFMNTGVEHPEAAVQAVSLAALFLRIRCTAAPLQFLNYHTSFCMQAVGSGRGTLLHAALRELVFYIPFMLLLDRLLGINGLVCALIAGEGCGALTALLLLRQTMRKPREDTI